MRLPDEMDDAGLDRLLRALADATRRGLLDRLRDAPGLTQAELAAGFPRTRQALSKHLALLEAAGLVVPVWRGREKRHYLNPAPLQALPSRWVTASAREDRAAAAALQRALRSAAPRGAGDAVAEALAAAPPPARPVADLAALAAARDYLGGSIDAVAALAGALPAAAGHERPAGGGFSIAEHLWHLADLESLGWTPRFERVLAEARPRLPGVDGDRLAAEGRYNERPWRDAARRFAAQRRRTLKAIARLDAAALERPLVFAGRRSSVGDLLAAMVAHDHEHRTEMAARWLEGKKEHPR